LEPVGQQPLGDAGLLRREGEIVAQWSQDRTLAELLPCGQERPGRRRHPLALALELSERFAPGGELRHRLLDFAPLHPHRRLVFACRRQAVARALQLGGRLALLSLARGERGARGLEGVTRRGVLLLRNPEPLLGLSLQSSQLLELAVERGRFAAQGPGVLGRMLERGLELADLLALPAQLLARLVL
jgi:hypothetical protein